MNCVRVALDEFALLHERGKRWRERAEPKTSQKLSARDHAGTLPRPNYTPASPAAAPAFELL